MPPACDAPVKATSAETEARAREPVVHVLDRTKTTHIESSTASASPRPTSLTRASRTLRSALGPAPGLGVRRAGARLSGSTADDQQADAENQNDELEGDAYVVLETCG